MNKVLLLVLLLNSVKIFSFESTSEPVNPFNQFMAPSGGINMYSGDVAYSHQLATVKGRNSLDINLSLSYSSNIHSAVRCGNDRSPTGWTGLGWCLGSGAVICDHKGTTNEADDEYVLISATGVASRIIRQSGLLCHVYEDTGKSWDSLPDFSTLIPVDSSFAGSISLTHRGLKNEYYGMVFEGIFTMNYSTYDSVDFILTCDDGARLYLDDTLVIDHDGKHSCSAETATVSLKESYRIRLEYFQAASTCCLKLEYAINGDSAREIPPNQFYPKGSSVYKELDKVRYFIENDPYTRIEPVFGDWQIIKGWLVTTVDGTKQYYGDTEYPSPDSSTRFTFLFSSTHVGQGWGSTPRLYPYRWDLNRIVNVAGNTQRYTYQQETEALKVGNWNSDSLTPPMRYTKASYLKRITTPEGKHVDFELEEKGGNEP